MNIQKERSERTLDEIYALVYTALYVIYKGYDLSYFCAYSGTNVDELNYWSELYAAEALAALKCVIPKQVQDLAKKDNKSDEYLLLIEEDLNEFHKTVEVALMK